MHPTESEVERHHHIVQEQALGAVRHDADKHRSSAPSQDSLFDILARVETAINALLALSPVSPLERVRAETPNRRGAPVTQYGWDNERRTLETDAHERKWMDQQAKLRQIAAVTRCGSQHTNIRIIRQCAACGVTLGDESEDALEPRTGEAPPPRGCTCQFSHKRSCRVWLQGIDYCDCGNRHADWCPGATVNERFGSALRASDALRALRERAARE